MTHEVYIKCNDNFILLSQATEEQLKSIIDKREDKCLNCKKYKKIFSRDFCSSACEYNFNR